MADKERTLTDSEIAFVKEEARVLAADLAFYAKGPIRLHLIGGDQYAFTIDAGGGSAFIDMYLNPKVLFDVRNRERAIEVWRGMGVHELAHHLWPAKDQYKKAGEEGGSLLIDLLNLLDDEQNERRARAMNPEWGRYLQTTVAWVFRGKNKSGAEFQHEHLYGKADKSATPPGEVYLARRNEFAYYLRRNLPGVKDPQAKAALALIPRNLKDISKDDLLELARQVMKTLSADIAMPKVVPVQVKAEEDKSKEEPEAGTGAATPPPPVSLPKPSWLKGLFTNGWSYVVLALFVCGWLYFFGNDGFDGWDTTFWVLLAVTVVSVGVAGLAIWLDHLAKKNAVKRGLPPEERDGRWKTLKEAASEAWKNTRERVGRVKDRIVDGVAKVVDRYVPEPVIGVMEWLGKGIMLLLTGVGLIFVGLWWLLKKGWWLAKTIWSGLRRGAKWLWKNKYFRIFLLAAPIAALLAMVISLILKANWVHLLILLAILLLLLLLAWLFRKKIKAFVQGVGEPGGTDGGDEYDHSDEMLEFAVIDNIVPIEANEEVLRDTLPDVIPLAQQMRPYMEQCGLVTVDTEDREEGHDLGDDLERAALGDAAIFVDDEKVPRASVHIEVLIDCSGSMGGTCPGAKSMTKIELAKRFGVLVEESIKGVRGISAHFWGFTDRAIYDCGEPGQFRVTGLSAGGGNNDAGALWHVYKHAAKSGKELKIILMVSDGQPTECTWGALHNLVCRLEMAGYVPVQIAVDNIGDPAFKRYFVDLVGQPMASAIIDFGRMLLTLVEQQR